MLQLWDTLYKFHGKHKEKWVVNTEKVLIKGVLACCYNKSFNHKWIELEEIRNRE